MWCALILNGVIKLELPPQKYRIFDLKWGYKAGITATKVQNRYREPVSLSVTRAPNRGVLWRWNRLRCSEKNVLTHCLRCDFNWNCTLLTRCIARHNDGYKSVCAKTEKRYVDSDLRVLGYPVHSVHRSAQRRLLSARRNLSDQMNNFRQRRDGSGNQFSANCVELYLFSTTWLWRSIGRSAGPLSARHVHCPLEMSSVQRTVKILLFLCFCHLPKNWIELKKVTEECTGCQNRCQHLRALFPFCQHLRALSFVNIWGHWSNFVNIWGHYFIYRSVFCR